MTLQKPLAEPRTPAQMANLTRSTENDPEEYTCWRCKLASTCRYAFDEYNTNGDCLEDK